MNPSLADARNKAEALWSELGARFQRDMAKSERLRLLVTVAVAAVVISMLMGLSQLNGALERRYMASERSIAQLKQQIESSSWQERREQSQVLKSILEERFWTAETAGLAEAEFQRWLSSSLVRQKLEPQIRVTRVPLTPNNGLETASGPLAGVQRITAKIVMPFDQAGLLTFLAEIAESNKVMVVDRMIVRAGRNPRIDVDVSTYLRLQERAQ